MIPPDEGRVIAGYRIEGALGRGGMGVVYRAVQVALDRPVALKVIAPEVAEDPEFRERFRRESRIAARIEHQHVVPVYEAGEADGQLYIAMRFIHGTDLHAILRQTGRLEPPRAVAVVRQVGAALDAAHSHGLVHRDVKPGNVLMAEEDGEDHAYLTDFGLARRVGSSGDLTKSGMWVGTVDYIAPEQVTGASVDARADVYALGCVLFHALTGAVPYPREGDIPKLWAHVNEPPPEVSAWRDDLPPTVGDVLRRGMAKDPAARYPSAGDLGRAAHAALEGRDPSTSERSVATGAAAPTRLARTTPTPAVPTRQRRPRATRGWVLGGALAVLALVAVVLLVSTGEDGRRLVSYQVKGVVDLDVGQGRLVLVRSLGDRTVLSWLGIQADESATPQNVPLGNATIPASPDVGTDERSNPVLVYSACAEEGCDVYRYRFSQRPVRATVSTEGCDERRPAIADNDMAFAREGPACGLPTGLQFMRAGAAAPESADSVARGLDLSNGKLAWLTPTHLSIASVEGSPIRASQSLRPRNGDRFDPPIVVDGAFVYFVDRTASNRYFIGRVRALSERPKLQRYNPSAESKGAESKLIFGVSGGRVFFQDGPRILRDDDPTFRPVADALTSTEP